MPFRRLLPATVVVGLVHLVCALLSTSRCLAAWGDGLCGWQSLDREGSVWAGWWVGEALLSGLSPFHTTHNFVPVGQHPALQYNLLDSFLSAPFIQLLGPAPGYAVGLLLLLALVGLSATLLGRVSGLCWVGATACGLLVQFSTFVTGELVDGRPTQALVAPMALALAGVVAMSRGRISPAIVLGTGLAAALTGLTYWYGGAFLVLGAAVFWLAHVHRLEARQWAGLLAAGVVGALLVAPAVLALAEVGESLPGMSHDPVQTAVGLVSYGEVNAAKGSLLPGWPLFDGENVARIGLGVLLLAAVGTWRMRVGALPWLLVAAVGYVVALGPVLGGHGAPDAIALPLAFLYRHVPFFDRLWWPSRAVVLVTLSTAVLAGGAVSWLAERYKPVLAGLVLVVCVAADLPHGAVQAVLPAERNAPVDPLLYAGSGALLTTPVRGSSPAVRHVLWAQAHHGRPILGGLGEHMEQHSPPEFEAFTAENPVLEMLAALAGGDAGLVEIVPEDVQGLLAAGFTHVVIDPNSFPEQIGDAQAASHAAVLRQLWGEPEYEARGYGRWVIGELPAPVLVRYGFLPSP